MLNQHETLKGQGKAKLSASQKEREQKKENVTKHISSKDLAICRQRRVDMSGEDEIIEDISVKKESRFQ